MNIKTFRKLWKMALLCVILLNSLETFPQKNNKQFVINGQIDGAKDGTIVKLRDFDKAKTLDSAKILNGKFVLTGHVDEPTSCWLRSGTDVLYIHVYRNYN